MLSTLIKRPDRRPDFDETAVHRFQESDSLALETAPTNARQLDRRHFNRGATRTRPCDQVFS